VRPPGAAPRLENNLRSWNCARSNATWRMTPKTVHVANGIASAYTELALREGQYERLYLYFVCGPKFTIFFRPTEEGCCWSVTFPIFDMSIRPGDIRNQSRKLSQFAPKFERFLFTQILGADLPNIHTLSPLSCGTSPGKVSWAYSHLSWCAWHWQSRVQGEPKKYAT